VLGEESSAPHYDFDTECVLSSETWSQTVGKDCDLLAPALSACNTDCIECVSVTAMQLVSLQRHIQCMSLHDVHPTMVARSYVLPLSFIFDTQALLSPYCRAALRYV